MATGVPPLGGDISTADRTNLPSRAPPCNVCSLSRRNPSSGEAAAGADGRTGAKTAIGAWRAPVRLQSAVVIQCA